MDLFEYSPLPSENYIRIIELLPGDPNDAIRCDLAVELRHHTQSPYDAISYVWGERSYEDIICCERSMRITVNLADALRTLRAKNAKKSTRLWADAISINQHDTQEKNHQVKRMGMVYENATQVHVWLGRDEEGIAEDLFKLIRGWTRRLRDPSRASDAVTTNDLRKDLNRGRNLAKLMERPWFSRVWVVQEVALSESTYLHWGNAILEFADLVELACFYDGSSKLITVIGGDNTALRLLRTIFQCVYRTYGKTGSWVSNRSAHFKRLSQHHPSTSGLFLDILAVGRILRASDARDHVYAFLGNPLALDNEGNMVVEPDYSRDVEEVNLDVAKRLLERPSEYPYVLCFVQHNSIHCAEGGARPSWVPQWRNGSEEQKLIFTIGNIGLGSMAGGKPERMSYRIQNDQTLVLQGLIIDQLCWVSGLLKSENFALDRYRWDSSLWDEQHPYIDIFWEEVSIAYNNCIGLAKPLDQARYYDDFSLTLVTGYNTKEIKSQERNKRIIKAYHEVLRTKRTAEYLYSTSKYVVSKTKDAEAALFERETRNCSERRFGITKAGGFALVPKFARPGDICVVFLGMATPFIIRPAYRRRDKGLYYLVGEAYIHGAMRGQFEEQLDREKEDIVLI